MHTNRMVVFLIVTLNLAFIGKLRADQDVILTNEETLSEFYQQEILPYLEQHSKTGVLEYKDSSNNIVSLSYIEAKAEQARASIVLVHGLGERHEKYRELIYNFLTNNFNVYALTLRGHPGSSRTQESNHSLYVEDFSQYREDLEAFIEQIVNKDDELLLYAHSMGSAVSASYLTKHPNKFQAVVFSTPMFAPNLGAFPVFAAKLLTNAFDLFGFGATHAVGQDSDKPARFEDSATDSLLRWQLHQSTIESFPKEQWRSGASYRWTKEAIEATELLSSDPAVEDIKGPVLIFQAENDKWVKPQAQKDFCNRLINCEFASIKGAKHELYRAKDRIRKPYLEQVIRFYRKHSSKPAAIQTNE